MSALCQVCEKRRAKRACPGLHGEICAQCCGEQREVTIDCPLDCEYLAEARKHEPLPQLTESDIPHPDVRLTEGFLREHQDLVLFSSYSLLAASLQTEGAADGDVREALEAMIKTLRTRESGLIYETRPPNPYAAQIQDRLQVAFEELGKRMSEQTGLTAIRDAEILGCLVFLARVAVQHDNRRRRGRAFLDFLRSQFPAPSSNTPGVSALEG
ncbi:MAG: hypothetical protein ABI823_11440 [Bryobacteraceae bacterium]